MIDNPIKHLGKYAEKGCEAPSTAFKKGFTPWNKGKTLSKKHIKNLSLSHLGNKSPIKGKNAPWASKEKHWNWKGGIAIKQKDRNSLPYKNWRTDVFIRDDYTCQFCGKRGIKIEADHIFPYSLFPEKRFDLSNGRTLCKPCHKKTFTYLNRSMRRSHFFSTTSEFSLITNNKPIAEDDRNGYQRWDSASVECEVGDFLFAMIRILKAKRVLETGTYKGWSSAYMAAGMKENGLGLIDTIEFDPQHWQDDENLWGTLQVSEYIKLHKITIEEFNPEGEYDMMFLDSEPNLRFLELMRFYPYLKPGGYVFLHDLHRHLGQEANPNPDHPGWKNWPWGEIHEPIKEWMKNRELVPFYFPTPRGLTGFYKRHPGDYEIK